MPGPGASPSTAILIPSSPSTSPRKASSSSPPTSTNTTTNTASTTTSTTTASPPLSLRLLQHLLTTSTPAETRYVPHLNHLLQYSGLCNSSTNLQILVLSTSRYIATLVAQGHLGKDGELDAREIGIEIDVYEDGSHTVRLSVDEGIVERKGEGEGRMQEYASTLRNWAGMNRVVVSTGDETRE
jgi:hypothetical protein